MQRSLFGRNRKENAIVRNQAIGEKRHVNVRLPEELAMDIEARAKMHGTTLSAEIVAMLDAGINTTWDENLPQSYRITRERIRMEDRVTGHRITIRDLHEQLADIEELRDDHE